MSERRYLETRNFSYELSKNQSRIYQDKTLQVKVRGKKVNKKEIKLKQQRLRKVVEFWFGSGLELNSQSVIYLRQ